MTRKKTSGAAGVMYGKAAKIEAKKPAFVRVNIRLNTDIAAYLEDEASRTGSNVSALCSLAVTDWVDNRKISQGIKSISTGKQLSYNIAEQLKDPEVIKLIAERLAQLQAK